MPSDDEGLARRLSMSFIELGENYSVNN